MATGSPLDNPASNWRGDFRAWQPIALQAMAGALAGFVVEALGKVLSGEW